LVSGAQIIVGVQVKVTVLMVVEVLALSKAMTKENIE
jgi:hypothetical protein